MRSSSGAWPLTWAILAFSVFYVGCMQPASGRWGVFCNEQYSIDACKQEIESHGFAVFREYNHMLNVLHTSAPDMEDVVSDIILSITPDTQLFRQKKAVAPDATVTDPLFSEQWHLYNTGQNGASTDVDIHVTEVWNMGYSGIGVQIAFIDDGVQGDHPDFGSRYQTSDSADFNDDDSSAFPSETDDNHGTANAGVAVAGLNDGSCGVGVAYNSTLASIRLLGRSHFLFDEIPALFYSLSNNNIYVNAWGGTDCTLENDGQTSCSLTSIPSLVLSSIVSSVELGRDGKGNIYVWSSGNGGFYGDNVNYDGYANTIYSITVGSVNPSGTIAFYSEPGAALHLVAPSSGYLPDFSTGLISTTDRTGTAGYTSTDCTSDFSGSSVSASITAGVIALLLESNPALTWRDVKYILALTATRIDRASTSWELNGAGILVSHIYGFGLVNAKSAVELADGWTLMTSALIYDSDLLLVGDSIPDNDLINGVESVIVVPDDAVVQMVEHVIVDFSAIHPRRGDLVVKLISPSNHTSILAEVHSDDGSGYSNWKFMSVQHWSEPSVGEWRLQVFDGAAEKTGTVSAWQLSLYGTDTVIAPWRVCIQCVDAQENEEEDDSPPMVIEGPKVEKPIVVIVTPIVGLVVSGAYAVMLYRRKKEDAEMKAKREERRELRRQRRLAQKKAANMKWSAMRTRVKVSSLMGGEGGGFSIMGIPLRRNKGQLLSDSLALAAQRKSLAEPLVEGETREPVSARTLWSGLRSNVRIAQAAVTVGQAFIPLEDTEAPDPKPTQASIEDPPSPSKRWSDVRTNVKATAVMTGIRSNKSGIPAAALWKNVRKNAATANAVSKMKTAIKQPAPGSSMASLPSGRKLQTRQSTIGRVQARSRPRVPIGRTQWNNNQSSRSAAPSICIMGVNISARSSRSTTRSRTPKR